MALDYATNLENQEENHPVNQEDHGIRGKFKKKLKLLSEAILDNIEYHADNFRNDLREKDRELRGGFARRVARYQGPALLSLPMMIELHPRAK
ncbi:hypothetical protein FBEOM_3008 [Fusarium beomiforme]|uniref:Uncharacterized protein n=1 Tax=Fusarium beomiforme TaxID=44412 RepID=A0A9P5AQS8_9HYPO|nr:hypothetical protein FBEOM_3008 [Fusarium beomiforme]